MYFENKTRCLLRGCSLILLITGFPSRNDIIKYTLRRTIMLDTDYDKFSVLYEIALTVGKSLDLKTILDDVLEHIIDFMGIDAGVIYVIDEQTMRLIPVSIKNLSEEVVRELIAGRFMVGECLCGTIAQCNQELIIPERAYEDP